MDRTQGIGGSDIAAICGEHPYKSALEVYAETAGEVESEDLSDVPAVEWGNRLEGVVATKYAEELGVAIRRPGKTFQHKDDPWMLATPDALVDDGEGHEWGLEVKTAGIRSAHRWGQEGDAMPGEYLLQCMWYMAVMGHDRWDMAVLIGGQDYRTFTLERDPELEKELIARGRAFWFDNVLAKVPPLPDASNSAKEALARLYPKNELDMLESNEELDEWGAKLDEAKKNLKMWGVMEQEAENVIKAFIGDHEGVEGPWGKVTWKASKAYDNTDWEGTSVELIEMLIHGLPSRAEEVEAIIKGHTTQAGGSRRFYTNFEKEG